MPYSPTKGHATTSDMADMDIESSSSREQSGPMPEIMLSFNNTAGGAWDDRELVNAYDAAMDEFHMHHPGPGSWLDKMTAAMNKGQPLDGAKATSTAWYSASQPPDINGSASIAAKAPATKKQKTNPSKRAGPSTSNPYAPTASSSRPQAQAPASPAYSPPSPPGNGEGQYDSVVTGHDGYGNDGTGYDDTEEWYDESYALSAHPAAMSSHPQQQIQHQYQQPPAQAGPSHAGMGVTLGSGGMGGPAFGVQPTTDVSTFDAIGFAMTAQYWAGYWMGVSQAKLQAPPPASDLERNDFNQNTGQGRIRPSEQGERVEGPMAPGGQEGEPSNIFITRRQFGKPNGLKR